MSHGLIIRKYAPLLLLVFHSFCMLPIQAQTIDHSFVTKADIKTLRVRYVDSDVVERPWLTLGDKELRLEVSFDCLSHDIRQYSYSLHHLNADFTPSDLMPSQYVDGDSYADITDYGTSALTHTLYTHYSFVFPNEQMRPKVSGPYALKIYEDGNPDDVVAWVLFHVSEQSADVQATKRSNTDLEFNRRLQQIDVEVDMSKLPLNNTGEVSICLTQNGRRDNAVVVSRPTFVNGNTLVYSNNRDMIFEGGNEYRRFDISSEYIKGRGVDRIYFDHNMFHAYLFADESRSRAPYVYEPDANGQFVVNAERTDDDDFEADYMNVYFFLPSEPLFDGQVYVVGDFTGNELSHANAMSYDVEHKCYTFSKMLKQGAYEYQYLFLPKGQKKATTQTFEGSSWQTENEYTVYVYFRPFGCRYDRLIAIKRL